MHKNSVRFRYAFSFLLILVVVSLFMLVLYSFYRDNNMNHIQTETTEKYTYANEQFVYLLKQMQSEAASNTILQETLSASVQNEELNPQPICSTVKSMEEQLNGDVTVLFYVVGDKYIYTDSERMLYSAFTKRYSDRYDLIMSQFYTTLLTSRAPALQPIQNSEGNIGAFAEIIEIPSGQKGRSGRVIFLVPDSFVRGELEKIIGKMRGSLYLHDSKYTLLYEYHGEGGTDFPFATLIKRHGVGLQQDSADTVLLRVSNPEAGITGILSMGRDEFYKGIETSMRRIGLLIVLLLLALSAFFIWLVFYNYKPISQTVSNITGQPARNIRINEMELIQDYYRQTVEEAENLNSQISEMVPLITEHLMNLLIHGRISDRKELEALARRIGLSFPYSHFNVLYIQTQEMETVKELPPASLQRPLENTQISGTSVLSGILPEENALCVVLNVDGTPDPQERCRSVAEQILTTLKSSVFTGIRAGLGQPCTEIQKIEACFAEAIAAVMARGENGIRIYEPDPQNVISPDTIGPFRGMTCSLLTEAIRRGEGTLAVQTMENILSQIDRLAGSPVHYQYYTNNLINILLTFAEEERLRVSPGQINTLICCQNRQELKKNLEELIVQLCDDMKRHQEQSVTENSERLMSYILEHYMDQDLSIQSVSDAVGIHRTQVTAMIREELGTNFVQYISYLRMKAFKQKLLETDSTIADLVQQIGYTDVPNFLRKFKASEGMTPGQYRKVFGTGEH